MKPFFLLLLCACVPCGFTDAAPGDTNSPELHNLGGDGGRSTNLLAAGDWSEPVRDSAGYTLRGRLLVFEPGHLHFTNRGTGDVWDNAPVYVELENLSPRQADPVAIYFAVNDSLECDLRDARGKPAPLSTPHGYRGSTRPFTLQSWITIPADGSVRLRGDVRVGSSGATPPKDLTIYLNKQWSIPNGDTNLYLLSGTFSPPTNHPSPPDCHVWSGMLMLPPAKIQLHKP